ncbi:NUDIX domain-containing protein [bacterium]|nr:MAG: NUDIX domain-containing protein [bacterium]
MPHQLAAYAIVIMRKDNKILLLQRNESASFAPNHYSLIGGALEKDESFREAAVREVFEEIGIKIKVDDLKFVHTFQRRKVAHELVVCVFECTTWQGEPYNKELKKHTALAWFSEEALPKKMIPAHRNALTLIKQHLFYSEHQDPS